MKWILKCCVLLARSNERYLCYLSFPALKKRTRTNKKQYLSESWKKNKFRKFNNYTKLLNVRRNWASCKLVKWNKL